MPRFDGCVGIGLVMTSLSHTLHLSQRISTKSLCAISIMSFLSVTVLTMSDERIQMQIESIHNIEAADLVGTYEANSPEWHEARSGKIGGSQVGTIAGLNKWESPYTAWAKFTGKIPSEIPDNAAMEWGRRLEAVVIDKFRDDHPEMFVISEAGTWVNKERPYQLANPDALLEHDGQVSVLEIKTARYPDDWGPSGSGPEGVPPYYLTQVQWYMSCLGLDKAYVAVLITGSDYREYEVPADKFQQDADIQLVERFLDYCNTDKQPDWDGSESTYSTVRELHPEIEDAEVELGKLGADLQHALTNLDQVERHTRMLKSKVIATMGNAKRGLVNGQHTFSRQARGTGRPFLVTKK